MIDESYDLASFSCVGSANPTPFVAETPLGQLDCDTGWPDFKEREIPR